MSWGVITGEQKILPSSGNSNEVIFESDKPKKLHLLLRPGEEPYSYLEHAVEIETVENGQTVRKFKTIRCPKTSKNPYAQCPLCDGQRFKRRARNAANVYDYDSGCVRKLNQGETVWKPIATTQKMGIDPTSVDWVVMKTGTDRNNTDYTATNIGASQFQMTPAIEAQLYDIEAEYQPPTIEEMKSEIEAMGIKWEDAITPPQIQYPQTLQEALAHVMPNGKYKGQTMAALWNSDKSPRGMINFLATKSDRISEEKAAAQVILVNLGGANIPGVPKYDQNGTIQGGNVQVSAPATQAAPVVQSPAQISVQSPAATPTQPQGMQMQMPAQTPAAAPAAPATGDGRQGKIDEINSLLGKDRFIKGGAPLIINTLKQCGGGKTNISDFTDAELDAMLTECRK